MELKSRRLLTDLPSKPPRVHRLDVDPVELDRASVDVVEPLDQNDDGGLVDPEDPMMAVVLPASEC